MRTALIRIAILATFCLSAQAQVFDVPYAQEAKKEAPTRTLYIPAKNPQAIVLLFSGGGGALQVQDDGTTKNTHTLVRSRNLWAQYGISAVLVDTPNDLGNIKNNARFGKNHQQRILNVVRYYKEKFNLPIWLFGHSIGTTSVVTFANQGKEWQAMISGVAVAGTHFTATLDKEVSLPTLAIHHRQDGCKYDPVSASEDIIRSRPAKVRSQLTIIDGGVNSGHVCLSMAYHGFNQREGQLIEAAAKFILKK